jgi:hypothetical protein
MKAVPRNLHIVLPASKLSLGPLQHQVAGGESLKRNSVRCIEYALLGLFSLCVSRLFDNLFSTFQSGLISRVTATTNGGTVLRRFEALRVDSRKKDSGMPNGQNVNYLVMIGAVLVIVLVALAL